APGGRGGDRRLRRFDRRFDLLLELVGGLPERAARVGRRRRDVLEQGGGDAPLAREVAIAQRAQIRLARNRREVAFERPLQVGDVHAAVLATRGQEIRKSGDALLAPALLTS